MNFISSRKNKRGKRPRKVRNRKVMRGAFQMSLREVESKPWVRMRKREREKGVSLLKEPCEEEIKTHHRRDRFSICPRLHHSFSLSLVHFLSLSRSSLSFSLSGTRSWKSLINALTLSFPLFHSRALQRRTIPHSSLSLSLSLQVGSLTF